MVDADGIPAVRDYDLHGPISKSDLTLDLRLELRMSINGTYAFA